MDRPNALKVGMVVPNDVDYGLDLANALHSLGIQVTMYLSSARMALYLSDGDPERSWSPDQLRSRLFDLGLLPSGCGVRFYHYPKIRDVRSFNVIRRIKRTILEDGIDVAHLLAGPGDLWSSVLSHIVRRIPVVSTMIIPNPNVGEDLPNSVILGVNKFLAGGSDVVIVNGASQVEFLRNRFRVPSERVVYVPLGPRTTALRWTKQRNDEERGTVLFFGRAHPHKGLEFLVRAQPIISRHVPEARILILAHGRDLERCRGMIQDESKFEIHEGFLPGTEANSYFERASLVVLPYLSASTSGILMTAYVFGKPVVATSVGCLPEYVLEGTTGLLVRPSDVENLAGAVIRLLSNDGLRKEMGKNAREWAMKTERRVASETAKAYEKAIRLHGKSVANN